jgi:hypothetical protein
VGWSSIWKGRKSWIAFSASGFLVLIRTLPPAGNSSKLEEISARFSFTTGAAGGPWSGTNMGMETSPFENVMTMCVRWERISLRLHGPHECAHELAVYLRRNRIHVYILSGKEFASVFYAVNSGWLNLNFLESSGREFGVIFVFFEGTRNAANPEKHALANLWQHLPMRYNIGHGKAAAWPQHPKGFLQYTVLVPGKG